MWERVCFWNRRRSVARTRSGRWLRDKRVLIVHASRQWSRGLIGTPGRNHINVNWHKTKGARILLFFSKDASRTLFYVDRQWRLWCDRTDRQARRSPHYTQMHFKTPKWLDAGHIKFTLFCNEWANSQYRYQQYIIEGIGININR